MRTFNFKKDWLFLATTLGFIISINLSWNDIKGLRFISIIILLSLSLVTITIKQMEDEQK